MATTCNLFIGLSDFGKGVADYVLRTNRIHPTTKQEGM